MSSAPTYEGESSASSAAVPGCRKSWKRWTTYPMNPCRRRSSRSWRTRRSSTKALLSKFILDHAQLSGRDKLPYICINFDSPTVRAGDPKTVLMEAVRQLAIQYPAFTVTFTAQRNRWQTALLELSDLTDTAHRLR